MIDPSVLGTINLAVTSGLIVLIWIVQLVHYPIFHFIAQTHFTEAMEFHQKKITIIVLPLMLLEMAVSIALLYFESNLMNWLLMALVLAIWLSTFLWQVPAHQKLLAGPDKIAIQNLIASNWLRTSLWSLKLLIIVFILGMK
jgi:hypothetical protein